MASLGLGPLAREGKLDHHAVGAHQLEGMGGAKPHITNVYTYLITTTPKSHVDADWRIGSR
ncbi:hypothetical protein [Corynebacterium pseudodiphtheriticum]|uniref:hypothetical protein n=1 Tax=Corynebacterium pseudodiphtheriticum TaxID=37637 RepID=UPI000F865B7E|nr:hypothetical protein [Corynebacterium pseudodiphtheriticum]MCG7252321.1 hypothetical protein [Corynebacterium pseudodiphtheriticum]MDK4286870.1 hypothetical protein [Corynebacterium pseudodiphtheriticum]MDK4305830.1 hypothetical protein [Corynebacterium pseudodiphtheriticum]MDK4316321.1 hypothetical protein [Corynebacterium pseudodiphtheriticum]MDK8709596.1 hypothetical protein [Corynebacterium pseudodiphtheriticum]